MVGRVFLGKYKILRLLDEGGMSRVYLARQTNPDREVVVKVLKETHLKQPKACEHFRREIHITSRFQHPFAVGFYDGASETRQGPVLVLEYLRGVDLNLLLHQEKRFTTERTGRLLCQLCNVLQAAHQAGIVHRDLKPGNLMIQRPGESLEQLKLMDFGVAQMSSLLYISPDEVFDCTLPPAAGTPEYIAPEQVRGNEIDHRADLYAVGVLLFEMLTGQRPFVGATVNELLTAHANQAPPTFAELGLANLAPPALEQLLRDCLAKHPEQRPASASELLHRYESAVGKSFPLPTGVSAIQVDETTTEESTTPAKTADEHQAVEHRMEVSMPESMGAAEVKGLYSQPRRRNRGERSGPHSGARAGAMHQETVSGWLDSASTQGAPSNRVDRRSYRTAHESARSVPARPTDSCFGHAFEHRHGFGGMVYALRRH